MSHEHEHEHEHSQAASKRTSRRSPVRGWTGTGQPAEDHGLTPAQEQQWRAARLHQGRQVLQGYAARAAVRAGAPTNAAHAAHDGHAAHGGHAVQEGREATRTVPAGGWTGFDQVHFDQVYTDVAGGKFAAALGLLDRYWPPGARQGLRRWPDRGQALRRARTAHDGADATHAGDSAAIPR